ncbi:oleosin G-like [Prosopis cineraria]|uniref:oleosin G-like n=1 Tax=Prosopis cineraria TaxID=364024 RepID=UPI0024101AF2|nr:oleosin G-like [Prosopis cineraria]
MADPQPISANTQKVPDSKPEPSSDSFARQVLKHAPTPSQFFSVIAFFVIAALSLFVAGLTVAGITLTLVFLTPLIVLSSPIWVPAAAILFLFVVGFLAVAGFAVVMLAALSWTYRYFRGLNPPGSDRVDYARSRIYDTASHVKECAWEYGGFLQGKVKDAAPGA